MRERRSRRSAALAGLMLMIAVACTPPPPPGVDRINEWGTNGTVEITDYVMNSGSLAGFITNTTTSSLIEISGVSPIGVVVTTVSVSCVSAQTTVAAGGRQCDAEGTYVLDQPGIGGGVFTMAAEGTLITYGSGAIRTVFDGDIEGAPAAGVPPFTLQADLYDGLA